jgi:hypothetical protein
MVVVTEGVTVDAGVTASALAERVSAVLAQAPSSKTASHRAASQVRRRLRELRSARSGWFDDRFTSGHPYDARLPREGVGKPNHCVSAGGVATVDWEGDADDEAGAWAAQPQHRCCNLVGAA